MRRSHKINAAIAAYGNKHPKRRKQAELLLKICILPHLLARRITNAVKARRVWWQAAAVYCGMVLIFSVREGFPVYGSGPDTLEPVQSSSQPVLADTESDRVLAGAATGSADFPDSADFEGYAISGALSEADDLAAGSGSQAECGTVSNGDSSCGSAPGIGSVSDGDTSTGTAPPNDGGSADTAPSDGGGSSDTAPSDDGGSADTAPSDGGGSVDNTAPSDGGTVSGSDYVPVETPPEDKEPPESSFLADSEKEQSTRPADALLPDDSPGDHPAGTTVSGNGSRTVPADSKTLLQKPSEVIRVTVPSRITLMIDPYNQFGHGQVFSAELPIRNDSPFPLEADLIYLDYRVKDDNSLPGVPKDCALYLNNRATQERFPLSAGSYEYMDGFLLPPSEIAAYDFSGSLTEGSQTLWRDGDLSLKLIFRFRRAGDTDGET